MAFKTVIFSASGKIHDDMNISTKQFSVSTIKQRIRENKKNLRTRFRNFIRDYSKLVKQGKDLDELKKEFNKDLVLLLSEAADGVGKGITINRALNLTALIPATRPISNKINIVVRKTAKDYDQKGYIRPNLQIQFNDLLKELMVDITEKVFGGQVAEGLVDEPDDMEDLEEVDASAKKFSSSKITVFSSEDEVDEFMNLEDIDEMNVDDISEGRITFCSDVVPKRFSSTKQSHRVKAFNSGMKSICFLAPMGIVTEVTSAAIDWMKANKVLLSQKSDFNYDAEPYGDDKLKIVLYANGSDLNLENQNAIFDGKELPQGAEVYDHVASTPSPYQGIYDLIDAGLTTSSLMKIEKLIKGCDLEDLKVALENKYGSNPIPSLL